MRGRLLSLLWLVFCFGCSLSDDNPGISVFSSSSDFRESIEGWTADFADLPSGQDDSSFYELRFAYTDLPANLGTGKGLLLSGNNHSDDLFMFIKKKVSGLAPNTFYNLVFEVELASNARVGSVGIGGSPGESVYLKAGASDREPVKIKSDTQYVLNIDKGNQSTSGSDAVILGNIAIPSSSSDYMLITRNNVSSNTPFIVQSNAEGELWLIVGTDSGFEGTTTVYYTRIDVLFSASH